jgi:hypothetical protein
MAPFDAPLPAQVPADHRPTLADFGLRAPLTDRQAAVLLKVLDNTFSTLNIGYVASSADIAVMQSLHRLRLVNHERERVGPLGPTARSLTVWRLERRGSFLASAIRRGEVLTAETAALRAANDRSAA